MNDDDNALEFVTSTFYRSSFSVKKKVVLYQTTNNKLVYWKGKKK